MPKQSSPPLSVIIENIQQARKLAEAFNRIASFRTKGDTLRKEWDTFFAEVLALNSQIEMLRVFNDDGVATDAIPLEQLRKN